MSILLSQCAGVALALAAPVAAQNAPAPATAQDATAPIASVQSHGEVHLVVEPNLASGRMVLHLIARNRLGTPAAFSAANIKITTASGDPVALVPREALLDEAAGAPPGSSDAQVSGGYSTAALATNGAGQTDVSSYTGSMSTVTANRVPMDTIARADAQKSRPLTGAAAELDKVLLKPLAIAPGGLDGGQVVTQKLKFRGKAERAIDVTVEFAGDAHHFHLIAPRK